MSGYHARLSPSGASQYTVCSAAPIAQEGLPERSGDITRSGTAGHQVFKEILDSHGSALNYVGRVLHFGYHSDSDSHFESWTQNLADAVDWLHEVEITEQLAEHVDAAADFVRELHARVGGTIYTEIDVPIEQLTGETGATGRADVIIIAQGVVYVIDLKLGFVKVHASTAVSPGVRTPNLQLAKYALGAMAKYPARYTHAVLMVVQPTRHHISEHTISVEDLAVTAEFIRRAAAETRDNPTYRPEFVSCHYCRASGRCEPQYQRVMEIVSMPTSIGERYKHVSFVRDWADATEDLTKEALLRGEIVQSDDGVAYKVVEGRGGHRYFTAPEKVEHELQFYLQEDQLYKPRKMQSVAQIEKIAKRKKDCPIPPEVWEDLKQTIAKPPGSPTVVPADDPRQSIVNSADGFDEDYDLFGEM